MTPVRGMIFALFRVYSKVLGHAGLRTVAFLVHTFDSFECRRLRASFSTAGESVASCSSVYSHHTGTTPGGVHGRHPRVKNSSRHGSGHSAGGTVSVMSTPCRHTHSNAARFPRECGTWVAWSWDQVWLPCSGSGALIRGASPHQAGARRHPHPVPLIPGRPKAQDDRSGIAGSRRTTPSAATRP